MLRSAVVAFVLCVTPLMVHAQAPIPAVGISSADVQAFLKQLPGDAVSDRPIRVVDVGGSKVGVYGVLRPKASRQEAILHETNVSEVYYMLTGSATLVTGGTIAPPTRSAAGLTGTNVRGDRIEGGVTRRVAPGDIVIIPGRTPHWWSGLDGDITYLIVRSDPDGKQTLK